MARVTEAEVEEIYDGSGDITAAITISHQIVERELLDCGYEEDELKEIERYLAAHFADVSSGDSAITQIQQGERSVSYGVQYGKGLEGSIYGQTAMTLDTCGILANLGKRKATFDVL
mgnify:FL=1